MTYHIPVLLEESIEGLNIHPDGIYVDVTFGGGGHSMEILKRLRDGRLIAFDQDEDVIPNLPDDKRFLFLDQNFRFLKNNLKYNNISSIDGLIADLGVSFHQIDLPERGFTYRHDAPLDMRMNRAGTVTAASLLRSLDESALADIFYRYGELRNSKAIAGGIVMARSSGSIDTVNDLLEVVNRFGNRRQMVKFYSKVFQALRIAVNHEIDSLKEMLVQALSLLKRGGRLVVISYHSLEDRVVKNFMKTGNFEGEEDKDFYGNVRTPFNIVSKKAITPGNSELAVNRKARSARLRIAEKI